MNAATKDKLLRLALRLFGFIFLLIYPLGMIWPSGWVWHGGAGGYYLQMIAGVYAVLGIFLIIAAGNPGANRSLIAFTVWSSVVHAVIMAVQASGDAHEGGRPFWTLILLAGRLAIPGELYEAASVDGAGAWHRFRFITWPSISTLYVTCTFLSMIFTVGDFNSVYLLTGGGPADLTHVLATLGIRYLRLDQVGLAMASIVCALPLILPLVFVMMKRLSK